MPEVLVAFDARLTSSNGHRWIAQACGAAADDGLWEGWIEFLPLEPEESPIRTSRETEQPNRDDLMYWAQGLTAVYLDGALSRALAAGHATAPRRNAPAHTAFEGPARSGHAGDSLGAPRAVLNPFDVYQQGEDVLIAQLGALDTSRLREIAVAYGFAQRSESADASRETLTAAIVAGVRPSAGPSATHSAKEPRSEP